MHDDKLTIEELPAVNHGDAVWRLTGPLVITTFFEFQERVRAEKSQTLALDFSGVPYIDSTGIGALMSIYASRQKGWASPAAGGSPTARPRRFADNES
jgi:anti-anti-sigma regulatory factor